MIYKVPTIKESIEIIFRDNQFVLFDKNGSNHLSISKQVYVLLKLIDNKKSINEITSEYNELQKTSHSEEYIDNIIFKILERHNLDKDSENINKTPSYLKLNQLVLSKEIVSKISSIFTFLYKKQFFLFLILTTSFFLIFISFLFFNDIISFIKNINASNLSIYIIVMLFSGLIHEIGHTSAAKAFGAKSGGIGFGFYLLTPVLYADVSNIWILERKKRIIVNIGGIYFELIFASLLVLIAFFIGYKPLFFLPLAIVFKTLFNLNPFMRNDGYWVLSDAINTPNLRKTSDEVLLKLIKGVEKNKFDKKDYFLAMYSLINYILIYLFLFGLVILSPNSLISFPKDIYKIGIDIIKGFNIDFNQIIDLLIPLTFYFLLSKLLIYKIKKWIKK
jgi:putative peptide zinc metalloprotease protein